jgi:adenylate kinase
MTGLIVGGVPHDADLVQELAIEYIRKESCIILLTIACESTPTFYLPRSPRVINMNSRL